jgi:hypothetical protein
MLTILDAIRDPALFAPWFRDPSTWLAWFAFLAALFALPMDAEALALYQHHTQRREPPKEPPHEGWLVKGRRGGGSFIAAVTAVFVAVFRDYSGVLAPGERGTVMVLAADRRQARTVFRYIEGLIDNVPMLAGMVVGRTKESIDLSNRISIEVHTSSFRTVRGYTIVAAICDEIAFWRDDTSANPDAEVIAALRPGMSTVPGALLLGISSPYSRRGVLWDAYRRHYGRDGSPVLVWQADTRSMNPTVDPAVIERAYKEDEASASAEYGAEFRRDIEGFVSREAIDAVVVPGRRELPPVEGVSYFGFCDPSGGSSDSMTLAVAHRENASAVLDLVLEVRPPCSPEVVVEDFAETLRRYRISQLTGDRYGAEWVAERFRKAGITYKPAEKPKSDLYRELLPAVNAQTVELLDHPKLTAQLCQLERRTARGGKDSIDHPPKAHDDLANACAGVVHLVLGRPRGVTPSDLYGAPEDKHPEPEFGPVESTGGIGATTRTQLGGRH